MALVEQEGATSRTPHTPSEQWFGKVTPPTDQHGVEAELLRLLESLRPKPLGYTPPWPA